MSSPSPTSPRRARLTSRRRGVAAKALYFACLALSSLALLRLLSFHSSVRARKTGHLQTGIRRPLRNLQDPGGGRQEALLLQGQHSTRSQGSQLWVAEGMGDAKESPYAEETQMHIQPSSNGVITRVKAERSVKGEPGSAAGAVGDVPAAGPGSQGFLPVAEPEPEAPPALVQHDRGLSRQLLERVAVNKTVAITIANYDHRDFAVNWAAHAQALNLSNFLIAATEPSLLRFLDDRNIPAYLVNIHLPKETLTLRSAAFNTLVRYKAQLAVDVTGMGFDLLFSDVDAILLDNPFPFFSKYPAADVLCTNDRASSSAIGLDDLEAWQSSRRDQLNIGFTFFRASSHAFCKEWLSLLMGDIGETWVQKAFNDVAWKNATDFGGALFSGWDGGVLMGVLPVWRFCAGYNYFVRPVPRPEAVIVAHATKVRAQAKRHRLREAGLWKDLPPYFTPPAGVLAMKPQLPPVLEVRASANLLLHSTWLQVELVDYQLMQVKHLLALASITGRAAILPKFLSREDCITPANEKAGLVHIPADQVINIEEMAKELPPETYGPPIDWREASFLNKPLAQPLLSSTATVKICSQDDSSCLREVRIPPVFEGGAARVSGASAKYEDIAALLGGTSAQVVHLVGLDHLAGGFHSQKLGRQFEWRVSRYAKSCCCNTWEWRYPRMAYSLNATDLGRYTDPFGWGEGAASTESRKT